MGLGSCSMSLRMNVKGITTTRMAMTRAEIHIGIGPSPAPGTEAALDPIAILAFGRGPIVCFQSGEISNEQIPQTVLGFPTRVFTADDLHRRFQIPKFGARPICRQSFHQCQ